VNMAEFPVISANALPSAEEIAAGEEALKAMIRVGREPRKSTVLPSGHVESDNSLTANNGIGVGSILYYPVPWFGAERDAVLADAHELAGNEIEMGITSAAELGLEDAESPEVKELPGWMIQAVGPEFPLRSFAEKVALNRGVNLRDEQYRIYKSENAALEVIGECLNEAEPNGFYTSHRQAIQRAAVAVAKGKPTTTTKPADATASTASKSKAEAFKARCENFLQTMKKSSSGARVEFKARRISPALARKPQINRTVSSQSSRAAGRVPKRADMSHTSRGLLGRINRRVREGLTGEVQALIREHGEVGVKEMLELDTKATGPALLKELCDLFAAGDPMNELSTEPGRDDPSGDVDLSGDETGVGQDVYGVYPLVVYLAIADYMEEADGDLEAACGLAATDDETAGASALIDAKQVSGGSLPSEVMLDDPVYGQYDDDEPSDQSNAIWVVNIIGPRDFMLQFVPAYAQEVLEYGVDDAAQEINEIEWMDDEPDHSQDVDPLANTEEDEPGDDTRGDGRYTDDDMDDEQGE